MISNDGFGKNIPPLKKYVLIYFSQKGLSEPEAIHFFDHFNQKNWSNHQGKILSNWKMTAWEWILKKTIL